MIGGIVYGQDTVAATDPNWSSVTSLLHFNGADGSTTFTDETGRAWTPTNGAKISTAASRFGGSSLGVGAVNGVPNSYITTASSADFAYGTGDFTWEAFIYRAANPASNEYILDHGAVNGGTLFVASSGKVGYYNPTTGLGALYTPASSASIIILSSWNHITATRSAGITRLFVNGVNVAQAADTHNWSGPTSLSIGKGNSWNGHIDEVRITKGVARYTGNFVVPSSEFPNA